jgi:thioredoxin 1
MNRLPGEETMNAHAALPISDATFRSEVLDSDRPVLVDFWAPWCPPCRQLAPTLDAIARDLGGVAKVAKLDVDTNPETAATYRVASIPTVLVFRGGREVGRLVGLKTRDEYERALREAGASF